MEQLLRVGVITSTHGLQGEVKVYPTTEDPARFKKLKHVVLQINGKTEELGITGVKFFKNLVILKFKGRDKIEDVMGYKGGELYVTRDQAIPLKEDEYFIADLIGLEVRLEDGSRLGTLTDVILTGANDVYSVEMDDGREVLIPAIRQCVLQVDLEAGMMEVHLLDGMLGG